MTTTSAPVLTRRQVRTAQRGAHLIAATALLANLYATPLLGTGFTAAVQWGVVPVVVLSGLALWKWPAIRRALRGRG